MVVVVRAGLEEDEEGTGEGVRGGESKEGREDAEEDGDGFVISLLVCLGWCRRLWWCGVCMRWCECVSGGAWV